jgi:hypothetical protein
MQMLGDSLGDRVTDAITSSIAAQTEAVIKNIVEVLPKGRKHRIGPDESDAAEEEEEIIAKRTRKRGLTGRKLTGPKGHINFFHVSDRPIYKGARVFITAAQNAFRSFLRSKGLLPLASEPLPPQVPIDVLQAFERDGQPIPDVTNIQLDWQTSLIKSKWNRQATCLLAEAFLCALQAGEYPEVKYSSTMTLESVTKTCIRKLTRVLERAHLARVASETIDEDILRKIAEAPGRELIRSRRYTRRQNVCACHYFLNYHPPDRP